MLTYFISNSSTMKGFFKCRNNNQGMPIIIHRHKFYKNPGFILKTFGFKEKNAKLMPVDLIFLNFSTKNFKKNIFIVVNQGESEYGCAYTFQIHTRSFKTTNMQSNSLVKTLSSPQILHNILGGVKPSTSPILVVKKPNGLSFAVKIRLIPC